MIGSNLSASLAMTNTSGFASNYRWHRIPLAAELAAATSYWVGWQVIAGIACSSTPSFSMMYDGSGSDRYYVTTDKYAADGGRFSETNSTRQYSVRAHVIY